MEDYFKSLDKMIEEGTLCNSRSSQDFWHISFKDDVTLSSRRPDPSYLLRIDELLVRALRSELTQLTMARGMKCATQYYFGKSMLEVQGMFHPKDNKVVHCTYPIVRLLFSHTDESYEDRQQKKERRDRVLRSAVSLQEALLVFSASGKAVYRVTSDARQIGAYALTRSGSGKSKEIPLKGCTWGGLFYSNFKSEIDGEMRNKDVIKIVMPPDYNGLYNPIFENRKGESRYLHVWENEYSRMLPLVLKLREK